MKRSVMFLVVLLCFVGSVLAACSDDAATTESSAAAAASQGSTETITLKMASNKTEASWEGQIMQKIADAVQERTQGQVKIDIYWAESLAKMTDEWTAVSSGISDIAFISPNMFPADFPLAGVVGLPYLMNPSKLQTADECKTLLDPIFEKYIKPEFAAVHVLHPVYQTVVGAGLYTVDKLIQTPSDLSGLQISTSAKTPQAVLSALGATPVAISPNEIYQALEKGLCDGYMGSLGFSAASKRYEPCKYCLLIHEMANTRDLLVLVVNQKIWDGLPANVKEVLEGLRPLCDEYTNGYTADDNAAIELMKNDGLIFNEIAEQNKAAFRDATAGVRQSWIDEMNAKGLPASDLVADIQEAMK